jgi:hypothetical protein
VALLVVLATEADLLFVAANTGFGGPQVLSTWRQIHGCRTGSASVDPPGDAERHRHGSPRRWSSSRAAAASTFWSCSIRSTVPDFHATARPVHLLRRARAGSPVAARLVFSGIGLVVTAILAVTVVEIHEGEGSPWSSPRW